MQWLIEALRQHPEMALLLVLALGNAILAFGGSLIVRLIGSG